VNNKPHFLLKQSLLHVNGLENVPFTIEIYFVAGIKNVTSNNSLKQAAYHDLEVKLGSELKKSFTIK